MPKGIPDKNLFVPPPISGGANWIMNIQEHRAKKAGLHFDLRLNDPASTHAYS